MRMGDLIGAMERIAPLEHAESWDRVGLLVGSRGRDLDGPVVLTIDLTERVLAEALASDASAIVAYHPPIWDPLARVTDATPQQRIVMGCLERGIGVYSPHTALDAVPGGICDWLCEGLSGGLEGKIAGDCRALTPHASRPVTQEVKIVTFVPASHVDTLRNALATAGAGIIGGYQVCSFIAPGTGTFLGGAGTNPAVGSAGRLESASELRLEMVASKASLPLALQTLRRFHPYETPSVDVYDLLPHPQREYGAGRRLVLDRPVAVRALAERLKAFLGTPSVRFADAGHQGPVRVVGVCPGSGSSLLATAKAEGCEVYVTGECSHHQVLASLHAGVSVILGEHTGTERGYLPRLAARLTKELPGLDVRLATADVDPLQPI
jgi:dinuclear metal center YbgI/SA1388 family protein